MGTAQKGVEALELKRELKLWRNRFHRQTFGFSLSPISLGLIYFLRVAKHSRLLNFNNDSHK